MTERLHFHFPLSYIGEGNGNPLQCSCLENSMDGGAWWAAVYGVAQSRTRLKWLSRNRIARSYGNSMFNFLRNQQNVFQGSWTTLHSQQSTWQFWNAVSSAFQDILLSMVPHSFYIRVYTYIYIKRWVKVTQSWLTLCNPMGCSPPGSSACGILQARILEWVAVLQEIFLTQGLNPGLPCCRQILYHLSHQGIPYIWQPLIFFSPLISLPALCWRCSSDFCLDYPLVSTSLNNLIQPGDFKYPLFRVSLKA